MTKKLISICVPVYNEEDNIDSLYKRLSKVLEQESRYNFEILFTDNHSIDKTFEKLAAIALLDRRIKVIRFSKNFGFQKSIMANFLNCQGDAAIQIDADMQDPPELISQFLRKWEEGYKVVYGVRLARPESWILHSLRRVFYRLIDFISNDELPHDAGDFRLIDRCIIEELRNISDTQPYLRGLIASMGFNQIGIPYDRDERKAGKSKFNLARLVSLAMDGILQHSIVPLRIASFTGAGIFLLSVIGAFYYLITKLFFHNAYPVGLASLAIMLLFSIGLNAIFLGIIGEYIGAIYKNIKKGPFVIIEKKISSSEELNIQLEREIR